MAPLCHDHCLQLAPKAQQVHHLLQVLQRLQVQYWEQDEGSNIECKSGAHNLRPICLLKNRSLAQKLAQIGFSSWWKLASVHSLAVYCTKAVLVGSTIIDILAPSGRWLGTPGLSGLAQYHLQIAPPSLAYWSGQSSSIFLLVVV